MIRKIYFFLLILIIISISVYSFNKVKEFRKIQYLNDLMNFTSENLEIENIFKKGNIFILRHTNKHDLGTTAGHLQKESLFNLLPDLNKKISCLSIVGKLEAQVIGKIFNELNIFIDEIYSSPMCRASETAKIAFGKIDYIHDFLIYDGFFKDRDLKKKHKQFNDLFFKSLIDTNKNYLISTHSGPSKRVNLDFQIYEGGILIYNIKLQKPILLLQDVKSIIKFYEYYQKERNNWGSG